MLTSLYSYSDDFHWDIYKYYSEDNCWDEEKFITKYKNGEDEMNSKKKKVMREEICPMCGSQDTSYEYYVDESKIVWEKRELKFHVYCNGCNRDFWEVFDLVYLGSCYNKETFIEEEKIIE